MSPPYQVIPARASAKLSCRLVADQDPHKVYDAVVRFFEDRTPPDGRWTFRNFGVEPAFRARTDTPWLGAAKRALAAVYDCEPRLVGTGGSIPVVGLFRRILDVDSILIGFSLDDDRVHSPNEKFELTCYRRGIHSHAAMLDELRRS